jgi:hypothetical protein
MLDSTVNGEKVSGDWVSDSVLPGQVGYFNMIISGDKVHNGSRVGSAIFEDSEGSDELYYSDIRSLSFILFAGERSKEEYIVGPEESHLYFIKEPPIL